MAHDYYYYYFMSPGLNRKLEEMERIHGVLIGAHKSGTIQECQDAVDAAAGCHLDPVMTLILTFAPTKPYL